MPVLILADQADGQIKKTAFEALSYGAKVAELTGTTAEALVLGSVSDDLASFGKYGVQTVHHVNNDALNQFDAQVFTKVFAEAVKSVGANIIIFPNNLTARAVAPRLSARLKAGLIAGAVALPDVSNGFTVKKNVFSGKAYAHVSLNTEIKIIALNPNSFKVVTIEGTAEVKQLEIAVEPSKIKVTASDKVTGEIPLTEATLVVSGGRGLKGPENWALAVRLRATSRRERSTDYV